MDLISSTLHLLLTYIFYPLLVISVIVFLLGVACSVIFEADVATTFARRMIAGVVPVAVLAFALAAQGEGGSSVPAWVSSAAVIWKFVAGAFLGVFVVESSRHLGKTDSEAAISTYILLLSLISMLIIYLIITQSIGLLHVILFGFVVVGGIDVVLRGAPMKIN